MEFQIILVGCGNLGRRYLQGLLILDLKLSIKIIDNSEHSIVRAQKLFAESGGDRHERHVEFFSSTDSLSGFADLVIIATPSNGRAALVLELVSKISVSYWIVEKVLAQSLVDLDVINSAIKHSKGAWVNTPRRLMYWHRQLKGNLSGKGPIEVRKTGALWGLACNAIHFIDLVVWWSDEALRAVDTSGLDSEWIPSKRTGYFEVTGTLVAHYSGGSELIMSSKSTLIEDSLEVSTATGGYWSLDEINGIERNSAGIKNCGRIEFQSELTAPMVLSILENGRCSLPTLVESVAQHRIFLNEMLAHWNMSHQRDDNRLLIT